MSKIVDIHCHHKSNDPSIVEVYIADTESVSLSSLQTSGPICVGLHPWQINKFDYERFFPLLKQYLTHPDFFAIGEIGLDKAITVDFNKQIKIFEKQLELATKHHIKRIIIHCVKAHSEILEILKKRNYKNKILIHDFYGSIETANQYLRHDCYFSFGHKLFTNSNAQKVITQLPIEKVFLETDDQLDYTIFDIYQKACNLLNIEYSALEEALYTNYLSFSSIS